MSTSQSPVQPEATAAPNTSRPVVRAPFFEGENYRATVDELVHLCQFGNSLVALIGSKGLGKTTVLNKALEQLTVSAHCCFISAQTGDSIEHLLAQIAQSFGIALSPNADAGAILATVRSATPVGSLKHRVIVIDDAHRVNDKNLASIVSLMLGQQGYHLHILLSGDLALAPRLDQFEIDELPIYDIALQPLSGQAIEEYVQFRLKDAGHYKLETISPAELSALKDQTQGIPSEINSALNLYIVNQELEKNASQASDSAQDAPPLYVGPSVGEPHQLLSASQPISELDEPIATTSDTEAAQADTDTEAKMPYWHMGIMVFLIGLLMLGLLYLSQSGEEEAAPVAIELEPAIITTEPLSQSSPQDVSAPVNALPVEPTLAVPDAVASTRSDANTNNSPQSQVSTPSVAAAEPATSSQPSLAESSPTAASPSGDNGVGLSAPATPAVAEPQVVKPTTVKPVTSEPAVTAPVAPVVTQSAPPVRSTSPAISEPAASASSSAPAQWGANQFILQVTASGSKTGVQSFIDKQPNKARLTLITTSRNGKPWYVAAIGPFNSRAQAVATLNQLPQTQVNAGPWVRTVGSLR